jgi:hypothetical protein
MVVYIKKASEYRSESMIGKKGVHCLAVESWDIEQALEDAERHLFHAVYIYTDNRSLKILANRLSGALVLVK